MTQALIIFLVLFFQAGTGFGRDVQTVTVTELLKTSSSWDGTPLPVYSSGKPEVTIARIVIQPGAEFPLHKHPMINAGILLRGELIVTTEHQRTIHLKPGDAIAEVVNTWHHGKNEGQTPAEIIVFYAGTVGSPITIKQ